MKYFLPSRRPWKRWWKIVSTVTGSRDASCTSWIASTGTLCPSWWGVTLWLLWAGAEQWWWGRPVSGLLIPHHSQVHISSDSVAIVTASRSPPCWLLEVAPLINQCLPVIPRRPPWNPTLQEHLQQVLLNLCLYKNYWKQAYSYQRGQAKKGIY